MDKTYGGDTAAELRETLDAAARIIAEAADSIKAGCSIGDEWIDAEDKAYYEAQVATMNRLRDLLDALSAPAEATQAVAVPSGSDSPDRHAILNEAGEALLAAGYDNAYEVLYRMMEASRAAAPQAPIADAARAEPVAWLLRDQKIGTLLRNVVTISKEVAARHNGEPLYLSPRAHAELMRDSAPAQQPVDAARVQPVFDIPALVKRFLAWPLPERHASDGCVSDPDYQFPRSGTNLLDGREAEEMLRYVLSAHTAHQPAALQEDARDALQAEIDRLNAIINTPQSDDFLRAVSIEAEHQRQRWGSEHDAGKQPADWFWLVGYLAGKALQAHYAPNLEKAEHHIITTAAACKNWHLAMFGKTDMRPGIDGDAALQSHPEGDRG